MKDDGTYDLGQISKSGIKINFSHFLDKEWNTNMEWIISFIKNNSNFYENFLFFARWKAFTEQEENSIKQALLEMANEELKKWNIPRLFEWMEIIFPIFFDSFEIVIKSLPKIIQPEIAIKTPDIVSCSEEEAYNHFMNEWFDDEESKELARQLRRYRDALRMFRTIYREKLLLKWNDRKRTKFSQITSLSLWETLNQEALAV